MKRVMKRIVEPGRSCTRLYPGSSGARAIGPSYLFPAAVICMILVATWSAPASGASMANLAGEIQAFTVEDKSDHWSGGTIVVGGKTVIIPRNLLIDLPANRVTLAQLYADAPGACVASGETGLAKGDLCNKTGTGGFATISANKTNGGNIIAGDVLIDKGLESVTGVVSYIDYNDGYFRLDGNPGDDATGVMVRLNDPTSRHTVQRGLGCTPETLANNCSADPRFTLDPDNYTNVFSTGYPICIPSTEARTFVDVLGLGTTTAQAAANGTGDALCPTTNRTVNLGQPVDDSRRFAPVMLGDSVTAEGNFEIVDGVQFLSSHTTIVNKGLTTKNDPTQPDYLFLAEVEIDAPGFNNERVRTLFIGFTTLPSTNVTIWSIHRDPQTNSQNEFPLADVAGCELASGGGGGNCTNQGIGGGLGNNIFKMRHDVDFTQQPTDAKLSPCAHLRAGGFDVCPQGGTFAEDFGILSPIPHEIIARTEHGRLAGSVRTTLDINGNEGTNGLYLFPLGANLGGIGFPEFVEVNLDQVATPNIFEGITWNLDRRLSPNGCLETGCDATPQPLDPFPFSGLDPRTQAATPTGAYSDPAYTASPLSFARDRILSFVDGNIGKFNGNSTRLLPANGFVFPPVDPAPIPITDTPVVSLSFLPAGSPVLGVTLSASPAGPSAGGGTVTFTASANGVSGAYEYQFVGRRAGQAAFALAQPYSASNIFNWNTAGILGGTYEIQAQARNAGSAAAFEATQTMTYTITTPVATGVTITASPATPQLPGTNVTFTANATGGGVYEYQFIGRLVGSPVFSVARNYDPINTWTWNTTGVAPGNYEIVVLARAAGSTAAFEATATIFYTVSASTIAVSLGATPPSPATAGSSVTFTATATPAGGNYEYQFLGRRVGDPAFSIAQTYGPSNTWIWGSVAGSWEMQVQVRNVGSAEPFEAQQTIVYTVN